MGDDGNGTQPVTAEESPTTSNSSTAQMKRQRRNCFYGAGRRDIHFVVSRNRDGARERIQSLIFADMYMHPSYAAAPIKSSKHDFEIVLSSSLMPAGTVTDAAAAGLGTGFCPSNPTVTGATAAASSFERHRIDRILPLLLWCVGRWFLLS